LAQSPHFSGEKSAGSPKYTAPQDRLAEMPASSTVWAMVSVFIYMSAMQVVPEAIISASPRAVPAATQRSSSLASAGKM
jgi:hypothetical protein